jgi:hypothetical protein
MKSLLRFGQATIALALLASADTACALGQANEALVKKLNGPVADGHWLPIKPSLKEFLDCVTKKYGVQIDLHTKEFKAPKSGGAIELEKIEFEQLDRTVPRQLPTVRIGMALDLVLKQVGATYEPKDGVLHIIPRAAGKKTAFEPLDAQEEKRRDEQTQKMLKTPTSVETGAEPIEFGDMMVFLQDRFDLTILIDYGAFPKEAGQIPLSQRPVRLPRKLDDSLENVLKYLSVQIKARPEVHDGIIVIVPQKDT